ncbi:MULTISPECIES: antitoxin [Acidipropionibacterium]|uniref:antitoxin n=1 Tax=Acidipropionibacterium TaxID=1912215 RepID=UPI00041EBD24|nr:MULTISPECIES: antitoxin [Acidipropionibacterium]
MGLFDKAKDAVITHQDQIKDAVNSHEDQIDKAVDTAGDKVDSVTGGKFASQVDAAQDAVKKQTGNL